MRVTFKLFATLMDYLPREADRNTLTLDLDEPASPNQLIDRYSVPRAQVHLVMINGRYIAEEDRDAPLQDGDALAIWPPVAGG